MSGSTAALRPPPCPPAAAHAARRGHGAAGRGQEPGHARRARGGAAWPKRGQGRRLFACSGPIPPAPWRPRARWARPAMAWARGARPLVAGALVHHHQVCRPVCRPRAPPQTPGSFRCGLRLRARAGTGADVPDLTPRPPTCSCGSSSTHAPPPPRRVPALAPRLAWAPPCSLRRRRRPSRGPAPTRSAGRARCPATRSPRPSGWSSTPCAARSRSACSRTSALCCWPTLPCAPSWPRRLRRRGAPPRLRVVPASALIRSAR
jgi:hypothetical protein